MEEGIAVEDIILALARLPRGMFVGPIPAGKGEDQSQSVKLQLHWLSI